MIQNTTFLLCGPAPKFARHRRARQRQRLMRFTVVYNPARQSGRTWPLAAYRETMTATGGAGMVVRIGNYVVGDEYCPWLYGPTDVRY